MLIGAAIDFIEDMVRCGGPATNQYRDAARAFDAMHKREFVVQDGVSSRVSIIPEFRSLMERHWRVFRTTATMQGFAFTKPNGYAGDFEIIERIYNRSVSEDAALRKWDVFWHANPAAEAVRNRSQLVSKLVLDRKPSSLLSVGCGPGLDVRDLVGTSGSLEKVILLDNDEKAVARAKTNQAFAHAQRVEVEFQFRNALRFRSRAKIDMVWCSGLFDYLSDRTAVFLLKRFKDIVSSAGRIVVGNFSHENPSRAYMEGVSEWFLIHRSCDDLTRLASEAGLGNAEVVQDDTGVNLFLVCG